jgi:hypothetical protein
MVNAQAVANLASCCMYGEWTQENIPVAEDFFAGGGQAGELTELQNLIERLTNHFDPRELLSEHYESLPNAYKPPPE